MRDETARRQRADVEAAHPEEMRADFEMRLGNVVTMRSTARMTPAGVVAMGLSAAAIILACYVLVRAKR